MSNDLIQFRVKPELRHDFEALINAMGLELPNALRMFMQQSVNVGGLPFQPSPKRPNAETLAAMREVGTDTTTKYSNAKNFFDEYGI